MLILGRALRRIGTCLGEMVVDCLLLHDAFAKLAGGLYLSELTLYHCGRLSWDLVDESISIYLASSYVIICMH